MCTGFLAKLAIEGIAACSAGAALAHLLGGTSGVQPAVAPVRGAGFCYAGPNEAYGGCRQRGEHLGMSIETFTLVHVAISLVGIATGLVALGVPA